MNKPLKPAILDAPVSWSETETPEKIRIIRSAMRAGYSSAEVARKYFIGATKRAVLSFAERHIDKNDAAWLHTGTLEAIRARSNGAKAALAEAVKETAKPIEKRSPAPRMPRGIKFGEHKGNTTRRAPTPEKSTALAPSGVVLLDAPENVCKWPLWTGKAPPVDQQFICAKPASGSPCWCDDHRKRGFTGKRALSSGKLKESAK